MIIGLTGSIGMGKTTVTRQLAQLGAKIIHADAIVHQLLAKGGAGVASVSKLFPSVAKDGAIDRKALGAIVFADAKKRTQLEQILHPLVIAAEDDFARKAQRLGAKTVVFDIPLLFETGGQLRCDFTIAVTAPPFLQKQRVMKRPHMTEQKFHAILATQLPDREKCERADFIVQTGLGKAYSFRQLQDILWLVR